MSTNAKTFRLFISSTFSDFKAEREILQTKVFPHMQKYCAQKGNYTFQPIDLRWGVSNEAQLDQKTLELCLNEVRACKRYPHPNFLIMVGDRYGWVPLPYAIEKSEFETLLNQMSDNDKEIVLEWYREDSNQIPVSYIIRERTEPYDNYAKWETVETSLRDILQRSVNTAALNEEQKRKYFLSATEAEVEEGIFGYHENFTEFQKKLTKENPNIPKIDQKYIFGFLRTINDDITGTLFSDNYYEKSQEFKARIKQTISNTLESKTSLKSSEELSTEYLQNFEEQIITFLEKSVDDFVKEIKTLTPLHQEIEAQEYFAENKRQHFYGRQNIRRKIADYIKNEKHEALVIYGKSGSGKSALMAQAIKDAKIHKPLYRFIGATSNSSSTKDILISLFDQLGKDVRKENIYETFDQFCDRIQLEFQNIENKTVIFIDAIDQLVNDDYLYWLPSHLPENLKIIISTLNDEKYTEDSKYFNKLKNKTSNLLPITELENPLSLLHAILNSYNRTIQPHQEKYLQTLLKHNKYPLYISVAAEEIRHWKSYDTTNDDAPINEYGKKQSLANTQRGIIEEYISNLYSFYHHDKSLVEKVFGYIYASRDGLSESELIQLISIDKGFVEKLAPETWHDNPTKELPTVIWSRLLMQLKYFLRHKIQNGEELMYFFHREFEDVIKHYIAQQKMHESIITSVQEIIVNSKEEKFDVNRWGQLYVTVITEYLLRYMKDEFQNIFSDFILTRSDEWREQCLNMIMEESKSHMRYNRISEAIKIQELHHDINESLYTRNKGEYLNNYADSIYALKELYTKANRLKDADTLKRTLDDISSKKSIKLFLSSGFLDFVKEREFLHTRVFPYIKRYAYEHGYEFEPVDLKWGITDESSLDYGTTELVLNTIRSVTYSSSLLMYMVGDRYGWVPLPIQIEKEEFETLISLLEMERIMLLHEWYQLDMNNIPACYVLKERTGEYLNFEQWANVESQLRSILQSAAVQVFDDDERRAKYFYSLNEMEAMEGIVKFGPKSPLQLQREAYHDLPEQENVFAFIRDLSNKDQYSLPCRWFDDNYENVERFKHQMEVSLPPQNIFKASTTIIDEHSLDISYLQEFEGSVMVFLKNYIDKIVYEELELPPLEEELERQHKTLREYNNGFIGFEEHLKLIFNYLDSDTNSALVLHGPSGSGKSSIMAKAIELCQQEFYDVKVCFRFIGTSRYLNSSRQLLTSIFDELGVDLWDNLNDEAFEERVYSEISSLSERVLIFIDGLDQLENSETFKWLPEQLPSNVKIVLSALNDERYMYYSIYYKTLKLKSPLLLEVPPFDRPSEMLHNLLRKENRTLTADQEAYVIANCERKQVPLFLKIAVQEIKNWKSYDHQFNFDINNIVAEFIENLSLYYHHLPELVDRVFGYLLAYDEGLSENEFLELLSSDVAQKNAISQETWDMNTTKQLPQIVWYRLYFQILPLLGHRMQNGTAYIRLGNREIKNAIALSKDQKQMHESMILNVQNLINRYKDQGFHANRWGEIYASIVTSYNDKTRIKEYAEFIYSLDNKQWLTQYVNHVFNISKNHWKEEAYYEHLLYITEPLYYTDAEYWVEYYLENLHRLVNVLIKENELKRANMYQETSLSISKMLYSKNNARWAEVYTTALSNLVILYHAQYRVDDAIIAANECIKITEQLYKNDTDRWEKMYFMIQKKLSVLLKTH